MALLKYCHRFCPIASKAHMYVFADNKHQISQGPTCVDDNELGGQ